MSGGLILAFFDLEQEALLVVTCSGGGGGVDGHDLGLSCAAPVKVDSVGHGDVSDFGAGAFPSFGARLQINRDQRKEINSCRDQQLGLLLAARAANGGLRGLRTCGTLQGLELKLAEFSPSSANATVSTLSTGKAGFGRDASVAFVSDGSAVSLLVTLLDLNGQDELQTMRAMLGTFDMTR